MGRGQSQHTLTLLEACRNILAEIQPASVRAVCYRLFTMGLLASMKKNETNKISRLLTQAREQGAIPWEWICDETRGMEQAAQWRDPRQFMDTVKRAYRKDHWALQPTHVEVWSEKGTIRGTVQPVLDEFGIGFRVMHGYGSATAVNEIAMAADISDKPWVALYVGDFDPSGLHMSAVDLPGRLADYGAENLDIRRVALTEADVQGGTLPSFPLESKRADPRHNWYRDTFGHLAHGQCWELDALSPVILRNRLRQAIVDELDPVQWDRSVLAETAEQDSLTTYFAGWTSISVPASEYGAHP